MTWMILAAVVVLSAAALGIALNRMLREIPRALAALDQFGREMRPALIRVRTVTEELRERAPGV